MTNTQHTPGPWAYQDDNREFFRGYVTTKDAKKPICQIAPCTVGAAANARLIAACPKMLAALQAVADYWDGGPYYNKPDEVEALFRAAIAEATGQTD